MDSYDLRDDEKNRILRAWEYNEGIREDCLVQNVKEKILMRRQSGVESEKEKENEVFTSCAGVKRSVNTEKSKVLGETRNFITNRAPIPQKTKEEMDYSFDESYFSNY